MNEEARSGLQSLNEICIGLRAEILKLGTVTRNLMRDTEFETPENYVGQHGEMKANIMLSYRHLEDARMRLGKVLQAADDGVSCYDK